MTIKDILRLVPGIFILASIGLFLATDNRWWLALAGFVGLNLLQSSMTKWCFLENLLKKAGIKEY